MSASLPADVSDVLAAVLNADGPMHAVLREQVPHLSVRERCTCGCGTACFELDTSKVEPAPTGPGTVVAAEAQLVTEGGGVPLGAAAVAGLFGRLGLSALFVVAFTVGALSVFFDVAYQTPSSSW